jgi:competence protein ComEA
MLDCLPFISIQESKPMRILRLLPLIAMLAVTFAQPETPLRVSAEKIPPPAKLDINTATPAQLRSLPGMGDAYVRRIIAGRPYTAKNQLVTRGVLPAGAYSRIQDLIVAHRPK